MAILIIASTLKVSLSLICSKNYWLFLPALSKKFTHYSYFILILFPITPILFLNINGPCGPLMAHTHGRMAHLREYCQTEKFSEQASEFPIASWWQKSTKSYNSLFPNRKLKFSEQASELLIASWRHKSTKYYNSLFRKWECWCSEQNRNPISGPVLDISIFWQNYIRRGTFIDP